MLNLINVCVSFSHNGENVIQNLNLNINAGDFCILIGNNGSGKSTLIKSIAGECVLSAGKILINDQDVTHKNRSHIVANVTQNIDHGTISEMTMLENMVLSYMRAKNPSLRSYKRYEAKMKDYINLLGNGLVQYMHKPLGHLSGGQRQVVATLMAIVSEPQILLLDEHTSALDPKMQQVLMEYTAKSINLNKITSLMVTHKLEDAINYGNRLIMLYKGKIVLDVCGAEKSSLTLQQLEVSYAI